MIANPPDTIITNQLQYLKTHKLEDRDDKYETLPYIYWLPKYHKNPSSQRFITGAATCTTTRLSIFISDVLKYLLSVLRTHDKEQFESGNGIRRYFVVDSFNEVSTAAMKLNYVQSTTTLGSGDFSTMYTSIDHQDLMDTIKYSINEVRNIGRHTLNVLDPNDVWIEMKNGSVELVEKPRGGRHTHQPNRQLMDLDYFANMCKYLLDNCMVQVGDQVYQQRIGIPMGTNCSPALANIYLYAYESQFIDRLVQNNQLSVARSFNNTFRYIDDTLSLGNPHWDHYVSMDSAHGGIYPSSLQYSDTKINTSETTFLGMNIKLVGSKIRSTVYDKRRTFKFPIQRYPTLLSFIPTSIAYGVFIGRIHTFYNICSSPFDFVNQCLEPCRILYRQGAAKYQLIRSFDNFIMGKQTIRWNIKRQRLVELFSKTAGALSSNDRVQFENMFK